SRADLLGYWRWLGLASTPAVEVLPLGADFDGRPRPAVSDDRGGRPHVLCVGIIEPRKNQGFLLEVCDALWSEGLDFELDLVGRVNPHFGPPILRQLKALQRRHPRRIRH